MSSTKSGVTYYRCNHIGDSSIFYYKLIGNDLHVWSTYSKQWYLAFYSTISTAKDAGVEMIPISRKYIILSGRDD